MDIICIKSPINTHQKTQFNFEGYFTWNNVVTDVNRSPKYRCDASAYNCRPITSNMYMNRSIKKRTTIMEDMERTNVVTRT